MAANQNKGLTNYNSTIAYTSELKKEKEKIQKMMAIKEQNIIQALKDQDVGRKALLDKEKKIQKCNDKARKQMTRKIETLKV